MHTHQTTYYMKTTNILTGYSPGSLVRLCFSLHSRYYGYRRNSNIITGLGYPKYIVAFSALAKARRYCHTRPRISTLKRMGLCRFVLTCATYSTICSVGYNLLSYSWSFLDSWHCLIFIIIRQAGLKFNHLTMFIIDLNYIVPLDQIDAHMTNHVNSFESIIS
jgi:hypothetical protein